ncbi:hypothetical protein AruPA_18090 [Acidiphilium sp. PA]|uniref:hypothetical protein n=1 Tax=Acidiphilium sp. PA TaxID=2871705 RepID=UPI0022447704|nr:hypothetical protein [Acidiphilium sp. PA]MCW8308947.1 hypothetical protein [Acidiphilium sp. PA]
MEEHIEVDELVWQAQNVKRCDAPRPPVGDVCERDIIQLIGIGNNVSFDLELAKYGMTVLRFDHTIEQPPARHENFRFYSVGWGALTEGRFLCFEDIMSLYRRHASQRWILKFDIEGDEFDAITTTAADDLAIFDIIVCEVHDLHKLNDGDFFKKAKGLFAALARHHTPVHLHPNSYRDRTMVHNVLVPDVVELTYIRNDHGTFSGFSSDVIPGIFDGPNNPAQSDIELTKLLSPRVFREITASTSFGAPAVLGTSIMSREIGATS